MFFLLPLGKAAFRPFFFLQFFFSFFFLFSKLILLLLCWQSLLYVRSQSKCQTNYCSKSLLNLENWKKRRIDYYLFEFSTSSPFIELRIMVVKMYKEKNVIPTRRLELVLEREITMEILFSFCFLLIFQFPWFVFSTVPLSFYLTIVYLGSQKRKKW